ncbi:hypothetical protein JCM11491_004282 [Sporobolomyces phaffii]
MEGFELPTPPPLRYRTHEPVLTSAWTRVDQFSHRSTPTADDDDDDEWEEEEVEYVTLDFGPHLSRQSLTDASTFQLLAAESPNPVVRIGSSYFRGAHETSVGTEILLQPTATASGASSSRAEPGTRPTRGDAAAGRRQRGDDDGDGSSTSLQVVATTGSHRIVMTPVEIDYATRIPIGAPWTQPDVGAGRAGAAIDTPETTELLNQRFQDQPRAYQVARFKVRNHHANQTRLRAK